MTDYPRNRTAGRREKSAVAIAGKDLYSQGVLYGNGHTTTPRLDAEMAFTRFALSVENHVLDSVVT